MKEEARVSRKYVRLQVIECHNMHPRIQKAYLQVSHSTGDQRTGKSPLGTTVTVVFEPCGVGICRYFERYSEEHEA